jgi:hypothetical protein
MNKLIHKKRTKEQGVVLLSCLVFLLILLGIIRFAMTSSRLEDRKAGADFEVLTARQAADTALREAEKFILEQGYKYCLQNKNKTPKNGKPKEKSCKEDYNLAELASEVWTSDAKNNQGTSSTFEALGIDKLFNKGIYTQAYIKENYATCRPFWVCVDWSSDAKSVAISSQQMKSGVSAILPSIECTSCATVSGVKPRYVIERFLAKDIQDMDFPGESGVEKVSLKSKDVVVFRITAVGFGNGEGGAAVNTTNAMMQAIYTLNG